MSVELSQYQGNVQTQVANSTSVAEAQQGVGHDGSTPAPEDGVPVVVESGDTVSEIMARYGLDYNDRDDRAEFYRLNPQFDPGKADRRNDDLIYPDEVLYMPSGEPAPAPDPEGDAQTPPTQAEAAAATDEAAANLEAAENAEYPPELQHEQTEAVGQARTEFFDAVETEIEAGLNEYMEQNPDATPEQISDEAERLRHQIQGRSTTAAGMDDRSMEYRTQQAVNSASANQRGVNLDEVAPGTQINDGPYTDTSGPFEPNSRVELSNGTWIQTDENGYPDTDTDNNGVADPTTSAEAQTNTDSAAQAVQDAQDMEVPAGLEGEKDLAISEATTQLGNAVQQEVEVGLREFIEENPDATRDEIEAEAERLMHSIRGREGNGVITDTQAEARTEMAVENVIGEE